MLEALNLTRDEEALYLALLDRTKVTAGELAGAGVDDAAAALTGLEARGLVAACSDAEDSYRAVAPQALVHETLRDAEQSLAAVTASVGALSQRFARGHSAVPSLQEVECVDGRQALSRLRWWRDHARKELRVIDPTGAADDHPDEDGQGPRIADGFSVRGIYTQAVVDQPDRLEAVKWGLARGAQARTLTSAPVPLTLVDSTAAILPARSSDRYRDGIVVIRQSSVLDALVDYFEVLWAMALPLDAYRPSQAGALDSDDRTLLNLMAAGFSDETIGRRLGISGSDAQAQVARAIERLGAENRFQAGVQAARRGMF